MSAAFPDLYRPIADAGEELWAARLPGNLGFEGIPAMDEVNGRR